MSQLRNTTEIGKPVLARVKKIVHNGKRLNGRPKTWRREEIYLSRSGGLLALLAGGFALESTAAALGSRVPGRASLPNCWSTQDSLHVTLQPPQCCRVLQCFQRISILS